MTLTQMAILELVLKKTGQYRFYEVLMNEDESVCANKEVHINQNNNREVIAGVINRRSKSG